LLFVVAAVTGAFALSFLTTDEVLAHGSHCGVVPNPPCGRYYSGQGDGSWNGVDGYIHLVSWVPLQDPEHDFEAHWIGADLLNLGLWEWVQIGHRWGVSPPPDPIYQQPVLYTVVSSGCDGYSFNPYTNPPFRQAYYVYRPQGTATFNCAAGGTKELWYFKKGSWGSLPFDYGFISRASGTIHAMSEYGDFTHMEQGGFVCYGATASCGPGSSPGLHLYTSATNSWRLWDSRIATGILDDVGYIYSSMAHWYSFWTGGGG
jgi:hypothetical protein